MDMPKSPSTSENSSSSRDEHHSSDSAGRPSASNNAGSDRSRRRMFQRDPRRIGIPVCCPSIIDPNMVADLARVFVHIQDMRYRNMANRNLGASGGRDLDESNGPMIPRRRSIDENNGPMILRRRGIDESNSPMIPRRRGIDENNGPMIPGRRGIDENNGPMITGRRGLDESNSPMIQRRRGHDGNRVSHGSKKQDDGGKKGLGSSSKSSGDTERDGNNEEKSKPTKEENEKRCASCHVTKTPLWRDAEDGIPLCNGCGLRYKKYRIRCTGCCHVPKKEELQSKCTFCGSELSAPPLTS